MQLTPEAQTIISFPGPAFSVLPFVAVCFDNNSQYNWSWFGSFRERFGVFLSVCNKDIVYFILLDYINLTYINVGLEWGFLTPTANELCFLIH